MNIRLIAAGVVIYAGLVAAGMDPVAMFRTWLETQIIEQALSGLF